MNKDVFGIDNELITKIVKKICIINEATEGNITAGNICIIRLAVSFAIVNHCWNGSKDEDTIKDILNTVYNGCGSLRSVPFTFFNDLKKPSINNYDELVKEIMETL